MFHFSGQHIQYLVSQHVLCQDHRSTAVHRSTPLKITHKNRPKPGSHLSNSIICINSRPLGTTPQLPTGSGDVTPAGGMEYYYFSEIHDHLQENNASHRRVHMKTKKQIIN